MPRSLTPVCFLDAATVQSSDAITVRFQNMPSGALKNVLEFCSGKESAQNLTKFQKVRASVARYTHACLC